MIIFLWIRTKSGGLKKIPINKFQINNKAQILKNQIKYQANSLLLKQVWNSVLVFVIYLRFA